MALFQVEREIGALLDEPRIERRRAGSAGSTESIQHIEAGTFDQVTHGEGS